MPKVLIPIDSTAATTSRLIAKTVMSQLLYLADFDVAEIVYQERGGVSRTRTDNKETNPLRLDFDDYVIVEHTETYKEDTLDPTIYNQAHVPIMDAPKLGIHITPLHSKVELRFNITYRAKSFDKLNKWLSRFRQDRVLREASAYHSINYNYTLPVPLLDYIGRAYAATEAVGGYGLSLKEFLDNHFTSGLMVRKNLDGSASSTCVNVLNDGCHGRYTAMPEEITTTKEEPVSEVRFEYVLTYDKVIGLVLNYQHYVHNQVLSIAGLQTFASKEQTNRLPLTRHGKSGIPIQVTSKSPVHPIDTDIHFDLNDTWSPSTPLPNSECFLIVPVSIDLENPRMLFNLNDIPTEYYPGQALKLLTPGWDHLTTPYEYPIHLELFAVTDKETRLEISVDSDLNITALKDMLPRARHYLRFSILANLSEGKLENYLNTPDTLLELVHLRFPKVEMDVDRNHPTITTIGNGSRVTIPSLMRVLEYYSRMPAKVLTQHTSHLVMSSGITVKNRKS